MAAEMYYYRVEQKYLSTLYTNYSVTKDMLHPTTSRMDTI